MRICKLMTVAALLTFVTMGAATLQAVNETPAGQSVLLPRYLVQLGNDYDHFFTIEEAWEDGEPMNMLEAQWVEGFSEKKGLQQDLERLRQTVPNFTYEVNKQNPRIIHIIDARLKQLKGYGLESAIKSIDFTGTVFELVEAIGKQKLPVSPQKSLFTHEFWDNSTVARVKGEGLKVRDALSNYIPLEANKRVIWIARTKMGQKEMSYVRYP